MRRIMRHAPTQTNEEIELWAIARGSFFLKDVMVAHPGMDNFALEMSVEMSELLIKQIQEAKSVIPQDGNLHWLRINVSGLLVQEG